MSEGTMVDASELATVPAIEQQTPEIEAHVEDDVLDLDAAETEGEELEEGEGQEAAAELVEIERNGKRYAIPKELETELMMQADYTRKTQETAALKKTLQEQEQQIQHRSQATDEELQARAALMGIDAQLEQYGQLDWNRFEQEDPLTAHSEFRKFQQMKETRGQVANLLDNAQKQRSEQMEQAIATRLQETADYAQKNIKGWSPALDEKISDFAVKELGFEHQQLRRALNPQLYRMMHLAFLGQQALSKLDAKPAPTSQAKPLTTIASKAAPAARKDPASMSMDEYAAYRNRQEAAARARASR